MSIIKAYGSTTQSKRHVIKIFKNYTVKKPLIKNRLSGLKNSSGRSNCGKITVRHKGGGHKKRYRNISFKRNRFFEGIVCSIEYDPNRTAAIAAVYSINNKKLYYIIAPDNLKVGDIIKSGEKAELKIGHSLPVSKIPIGISIHNVSKNKNSGGIFSRAAGSYSLIREKKENQTQINLMSGKINFISSKAFATIGTTSNKDHMLIKRNKAGNSRWLNIRPTVRGVAMNPIDHPHGGGEGKKSGKNKTPWGKTKKQKMSRAKWKGPYIKLLSDGCFKVSRSTQIVPFFLNKRITVENGIKQKDFIVTHDIIGYKFGEFFFPRISHVFKKKKSKKK